MSNNSSPTPEQMRITRAVVFLVFGILMTIVGFWLVFIKFNLIKYPELFFAYPRAYILPITLAVSGPVCVILGLLSCRKK